jgi:hypothetical protein
MIYQLIHSIVVYLVLSHIAHVSHLAHLSHIAISEIAVHHIAHVAHVAHHVVITVSAYIGQQANENSSSQHSDFVLSGIGEKKDKPFLQFTKSVKATYFNVFFYFMVLLK